MRYVICGLIVAFVSTVGGASAFAQGDRTKVEVFGGFSHARLDTGFDEDDIDGIDVDPIGSRVGANGFEAAVTGNVHKYVGVKFDMSHHRKSESFSESYDGGGTYTASYKFRLNQFLGGLQFKNNMKEGSRVKPFAHVLAGIANHKISFEESYPEGNDGKSYDYSTSSNNFAMAFGGGIDLRAGKHVDIRLIQADYNPIWFRSQDLVTEGSGVSLSGRTLHNFRISFGVVFH